MSDDKYLKRLAKQYKWPEPSDDLKKRITRRSVTPQKPHTFSLNQLRSTISLSWQPALALTCAFILGISLGNANLNQTSQQDVGNIYMNTDYLLINSSTD